MSPLVRRTWSVTGETPRLDQKTASYRTVSGVGAITISPKRRQLIAVTNPLGETNTTVYDSDRR